MLLYGLHHSWIGLSLRRFSAGGLSDPTLTVQIVLRLLFHIG
jgi:hypothetical protein